MNVDWLIENFAEQPVVESASLATLSGDLETSQVQISRWVSSGVLIQLRRGYYLLAPRYRKREPDLHYLANLLVAPSYISLEYALGYYGLIPEYVAGITSITTGRPQTRETPIARFEYRHIAIRYYFGYETLEPDGMVPVDIATPEKALLDLIYFTPGRVDESFFDSIRLQNFETIDEARLKSYAGRFRGRKMLAAVDALKKYREEYL